MVVAGFLALAFGPTMLLVVLDFFSLDGAPSSRVAAFMGVNAGALIISLASALIGYLLAVPIMLIIKEAAFGGTAERPQAKLFAQGLVWASLPLRPLCGLPSSP